jgi:hypothetical protein
VLSWVVHEWPLFRACVAVCECVRVFSGPGAFAVVWVCVFTQTDEFWKGNESHRSYSYQHAVVFASPVVRGALFRMVLFY